MDVTKPKQYRNILSFRMNKMGHFWYMGKYSLHLEDPDKALGLDNSPNFLNSREVPSTNTNSTTSNQSVAITISYNHQYCRWEISISRRLLNACDDRNKLLQKCFKGYLQWKLSKSSTTTLLAKPATWAIQFILINKTMAEQCAFQL